MIIVDINFNWYKLVSEIWNWNIYCWIGFSMQFLFW